MATVTKENIGLLHEKLTVKLEKTDYLPSFEKTLKEYGKKANIPGFRKGMVPAGLIKKMYGPSLFTDEVLRSVDRELISYLQTDKLDIFAQPLPLETDIRQLDVNNPADYTFHFEIGMKPDFSLPNLSGFNITGYKVSATDDMINSEVLHSQTRFGSRKDVPAVETEENILQTRFVQVRENGEAMDGGIHKEISLLVKYFKDAQLRKDLIGKVAGDHITVQLREAFAQPEAGEIYGNLGLNEDDPNAGETNFRIEFIAVQFLEKRELNEDFFNELFPGQEIKTEAEFRNKIKDEIEAQWKSQARNQIQDQIFHQLVDHTPLSFPEEFLKKWLKTQGNANGENEQPIVKSDEQVEQEFPTFISQLKWTLISEKIVQDNAIQVLPEEIREMATQQLFGYMGNMGASLEGQPWVVDYIDKMMKDRRYVEDAHNRIQTRKVFEWAESQVKPVEKEISADEFRKMVEEHQHHHHH